MIKDKRFRKYKGSFSIVFLLIVAQVVSFLLSGDHLFGLQHKETLVNNLAFKSTEPFKMFGLTFISSYFVHYSLSHFFQDLVFLFFFSVMSETRIGTFKTVFVPILTHVTSLIGFMFTVEGEHIFLGSSLGGISLFVLYTLVSKKYFIYGLGVLILVAFSFYSKGDIYSSIAHISAAVFTSVFYLATKQSLSWSNKS